MDRHDGNTHQVTFGVFLLRIARFQGCFLHPSAFPTENTEKAKIYIANRAPFQRLVVGELELTLISPNFSNFQSKHRGNQGEIPHLFSRFRWEVQENW